MAENKRILLASRPVGMPAADNFRLEIAPVPRPAEGEVLVRIEMISLDPAMRGWMNEGTTYIRGVALGEVMRAFAAGRVIQSRHPAFADGDYVSGLLGAQSYAAVPARLLTRLDLSLGPLEWHLGVLGMPGMTAYFGLLERGKPQPGETVFISGAAGIIGSTVGQIARIKGCRAVGTAGSDEKCRYLIEECGFDGAINYKTEDVEARIRELCPKGINILYDNVGGDILDIGLAHLARGARVVICGAISQYNEPTVRGPRNYMKIVTARATLTGIIVFDFQERYPEAVEQLSKWLKNGQLHTRTDFVEGIENFYSALMKLYAGANFGKMILKV
ncbi:MAG: NADP-dependent oxidoreductase [Saprospiraceae bacterium]|nr:NADP-dependent oxidoreductase [Saprospiraceae bacterium]MDW8228207.1 NADP-dependent oxidoreductase [Saprospiraceae bacterium]